MSTKTHPLAAYLKAEGKSLSSFARDIKMSRMQLYRIMAGDNTTVSTLRLISNATKGKVSVSALLSQEPAQ